MLPGGGGRVGGGGGGGGGAVAADSESSWAPAPCVSFPLQIINKANACEAMYVHKYMQI